ncbi:hypothetical protein [Amycolatopsis taiwanensis]|uniref:hypothetical protein n=1 Tax=Amycolatopsis taiwanensis TaxID=342230 RepID=UPI0025534C1E|nr:hypothetical protein [Amycolatopsis taiwanensis]
MARSGVPVHRSQERRNAHPAPRTVKGAANSPVNGEVTEDMSKLVLAGNEPTS